MLRHTAVGILVSALLLSVSCQQRADGLPDSTEQSTPEVSTELGGPPLPSFPPPAVAQLMFYSVNGDRQSWFYSIDERGHIQWEDLAKFYKLAYGFSQERDTIRLSHGSDASVFFSNRPEPEAPGPIIWGLSESRRGAGVLRPPLPWFPLALLTDYSIHANSREINEIPSWNHRWVFVVEDPEEAAEWLTENGWVPVSSDALSRIPRQFRRYTLYYAAEVSSLRCEAGLDQSDGRALLVCWDTIPSSYAPIPEN